ncbi:secretin N-terminal domain-containing protein [Trinickia dinghuensis]|uniref:secretin N-terminal domain-containing protein n=1 Tax=Trinickia dinghuensis TaxID=2291023 RepID=UPI001FE2D7E5|nr:secretin N-terminal domain-containing protein [Trinickia dinghuensis]
MRNPSAVQRKFRTAYRRATDFMRLSLLVALPVLLVGCAAQLAYRDGQNLVAQGKIDEGLSKLGEAVARDPQDARYRQTWLAVRESTVARYDEEGDRLAASGAPADARKSYQQALAVDPRNERALEGLAGLEKAARRDALMDRAEAAAAKHDIDDARRLLDEVLTEAPAQPRALALQRKLRAAEGVSNVEATLARTYQKRIQIDFSDATLKQVFDVISRTAGLNFMFDKDVRTDQHVSIFLRNSTIEAAVRYLLATNELAQQVVDENTVLIYPNTPAKQKEYQELAVRTFFLSNADAKTVANTLKTILNVRDIVFDEKLNMVIVRDTPDVIKMAEKLVRLEDVAEPEVMLEVEVLEVQRDSLQNLGIAWPGSVTVTPLPLGSAVGSAGAAFGSTSSTAGSPALSLSDLLHQTTRSLGVSTLQATANANLQDSNAKLLTNPRIRVSNHEKAKILIGERVPNITSTATSTGFVSQSINYLDVGLTLEVEPTIHLDDTVGIKVSLEVSSLLNQITESSGTTAYEIGTRTASTVLQLKNGETDVLAGLIDSEERTSGNKVPGFGQVPVLGRLFGASSDDDKNTEIVLAITPHLVRNIRRPDSALAYFSSGTETGMQSLIRSNGLAGVPAVASPSSSPNVTVAIPAAEVRATPVSAPAAASIPEPKVQHKGTAQGKESTSLPVARAEQPRAARSTPANVNGTSATMAIEGAQQVKVGDTVTLTLAAQAHEPIASMSTMVSYDKSKLQFIDAVEGDFLRHGGAPTRFSTGLDPSGNVILADSVTGGVGSSSKGAFAVLHFRAISSAPQTVLRMHSGQATGIEGRPVALVPAPAYDIAVH